MKKDLHNDWKRLSVLTFKLREYSEELDLYCDIDGEELQLLIDLIQNETIKVYGKRAEYGVKQW